MPVATQLLMLSPTPAPHRHLLRYAGVAVAAVTIAAVAWVVGPRLAIPPRSITLATGPEGGAYAELGPRYAKILAKSGIRVRLLPTGGDVDNLARLRDPHSGVSVAFLQAGIATEEQRAGLASLGTIMYAPIWFFQRSDLPSFDFDDLAGKRLSIGPEGSGTRFVVSKLLGEAGLVTPGQLGNYTHSRAEQALLHGELDAVAIIAAWDSPVVRRLLANPKAALLKFPRVDAYVALNPFLSKLILPMGVGNLAKNLPREDVALLATKTNLAIREDLHPALQYLLLEAASDIHDGPGIFQRAGQFPAGEAVDLPLSAEASHFYKSGRPFLLRYLPFWLAVLVERLLILLIPLLAVLYPVFRVLPALFNRTMERRVLFHYRELKLLEGELEQRPTGVDVADLTAELNQLEERANRLRLPMKFAQTLYHLKQHIDLVRARINRHKAGP